jgi:hypothetical protein
VRPLAGPSDDTEPVHLPPVTKDAIDRLIPEPRRAGPTPADLAGEDTVALRLPDGLTEPKDRKRGKGSSAR